MIRIFKKSNDNLAALVLGLLLIGCVTGCTSAQVQNDRSGKDKGTANKIKVVNDSPKSRIDDVTDRINRKYAGYLSAAMWTFTHDYSEETKVDEILKELGTALTSLGNHDLAEEKKLERLKAFEIGFSEHLKSGDDATVAFASIVLGILGNQKFKQPLYRVMVEPYPNGKSTELEDSLARGSAAISLAMLGANEYKDDIAALLESNNYQDRSRGLTALATLNAKEFAKRVVDSALSKPNRIDGVGGSIDFLVMTETATEFKNEIVQLMSATYDSESAKAAMYALARIGAKDKSEAIAKLLDDRFKRGDAAKSLAILDAREFEDRIASLLIQETTNKKRDGLFIADASLALGVLGATKHVGILRDLIEAPEDYVRLYAAIGIVLMGESEHVEKAAKLVKEMKVKGAYMSSSDFHPYVEDNVTEVRTRLEQDVKKYATN